MKILKLEQQIADITGGKFFLAAETRQLMVQQQNIHWLAAQFFKALLATFSGERLKSHFLANILHM